ncbi:DUF87 domain-containing protein [Candidatus Parcubacteria bacterium]|nr:DUF87 domain-containing protein [Candidatus Parcubacteria bacterium]
MTEEAVRFNSPEEQIAYLRSRLESYGEKAGQTSEIVSQRIRDIHQELPVTMRHSPEVKETLTHVAGQSEDRRLAEMISVSQEKGVFHALSVAEKLEDWKHEDDFHDYLVGLVSQGIPLREVDEKGPMYRALSMTLFEIIIPDSSTSPEQGTQNLKTLISSMEQFYHGMISVAEEKKLGKNYFVLEVANSNESEDIVFFVSVPNEKKGLFEKQLRSVFPNAELVERRRDYNIFSEGSPTAGATASLGGPSAYPLRTAEAFDHDPLNTLISSFRKIPRDGAGAAVQIIFNPQGDTYSKRYNFALGKIQKGEKASEVVAERSLTADFSHTLSSLFATKKKVDPSAPVVADAEAIARIQKKLESPTVAVNIRIAASALNKAEALSIVSDLESAFNQFEAPGVNKLEWKSTDKASFFRNFAFRLYDDSAVMPLNLRELTAILHFHTVSLTGSSQLKQSKASEASAPAELPSTGTILGVNKYQGGEKEVRISAEDRLRHLYVIGQTGTGKSTLLKNIIIQDIKNGEGVCMIDPHGHDVLDVLANIPPERAGDVIYFDPASVDRPMALNMLEYDQSRPEEKTFVVNELFSIFQKLYGKVPESMGPMFEQYFRNATMLVIDDPASGSTLLDVSRVLSNKAFRSMKLERCKNPIVTQFWREVAEKAGGEGALANIVPYITSKFDVFLANDIMRPIIAQEHSSLNFREIMDGRKILLVNLSKGRLGDVNANLIGLILVGKILMAALSRSGGSANAYPPFYLHIDEFQNVTTNSISTILSEARKYKLSLTMAHQFIKQLEEDIKNAVFGNVGSMISFRVGADDAEYLEKQFAPVFAAKDLMNIDNYKAYVKMLVNGRPEKPFSLVTLPTTPGNRDNIDPIVETSRLKYGRNRDEVEREILAKYNPAPAPAPLENI